MEKKYSYSLCPEISNEVFIAVCQKIEQRWPELRKERLLIDVDGTMLQIYYQGQKEAVVYNDVEVGAVYIESDIDMDNLFGDFRTIQQMS